MKNKINLFVLFIALFSYSQTENDSIKTQNIEEIKINSSKVKINKLQSASQISIIGKEQIEFQNFQNTAEMLSNSGNLFVQRSQQGGGSPVIRGFEASRVLLLVDGIRMNNLIFRGGHLQNVITVDENFLENTYIQYGPTSSLYGSDALGGSVNMITKSAKLGTGFTGNVNTRYSSVNEEKSGYFDLNYGATNWASLTAFSYNDFGNLKMGKKQNHNGDFFGERSFYANTIQSPNTGLYQDQSIDNTNDKFTQVSSAYKQYNFMQKFSYKTTNEYKHGINFQYSTSSDINRYDRLTETSGNNPKFAEWYYGPQKRILGVYSLEKENVFAKTDFKLDAAYQNVEESRHDRRFNNFNINHRYENVTMYSLGANFETKLNKGNVYYGVESYYEDLASTAQRININSGIESVVNTRYPNGDNNMLRSDVYVSYSSLKTIKTHWNIGARAGYTSLKSNVADNTAFPFLNEDIKQSNFTYSGNVGLVHNASDNFIIKTNVSTGYRVPNIDDLAKIFESTSGSVIVPNKDLKPEQTITTDLGFVLKDKANNIVLETTYYYTRMFDAIVTDNFTYNGQTTIDFGGNPNSIILANQNKRKAFVTGFNSNFHYEFIKNLKLDASFNYTLGRISDNGNRSPLDHIPPYYGKVGFTYTPKWFMLEAYMLYNGKKDISDYFLNGEDNEQYAPKNGMPAWETYSIKIGSKQFFGFNLYAGVENILDTQYRYFASGINAGGRNIYGGLKYHF